MTKNEFLKAIEKKLAILSTEDLNKFLEYYSEMIDDRIEDGMSENEAVEAMGSVDEIVNRILEETPLPKLVKAKVKPQRSVRVWEIILIILGSPVWLPLAAAANAVLFSVYLVLWALVAVLYSFVIALGATFVVGTFCSVAYFIAETNSAAFLILGGALFCGGLAILIFFISAKATVGTCLILKKFILSLKVAFAGKK